MSALARGKELARAGIREHAQWRLEGEGRVGGGPVSEQRRYMHKSVLSPKTMSMRSECVCGTDRGRESAGSAEQTGSTRGLVRSWRALYNACVLREGERERALCRDEACSLEMGGGRGGYRRPCLRATEMHTHERAGTREMSMYASRGREHTC